MIGTFLLTSLCNYVDYKNPSTIWPCVQESWFYNSIIFIGLILYIYFGYICHKAKVPINIIFSVNLILSFVLAMVFKGTFFNDLFAVSLILVMGAIAAGMVKRFLSPY